MMSVARNVADASQSIKAGKWERSRLTGIEAKGKTLAIVGLGKGESYHALMERIGLIQGSRSHGCQNCQRVRNAADCL